MQNFDSAENQTTNVMEESQMGGEGKEKDETRSSMATNRQTTDYDMNTSLERHDDDKAVVAVTTQESKEMFREMAMRIASIGELETGSSA